MNADTPATPTPSDQTHQDRLFTLEQANRALVYVRRVAQDLSEAHETTQQLKDQAEQSQDLQDRLQHRESLDRLTELRLELQDTGVEIVDEQQGVLNFLGWNEGQEVRFQWKLGQKEVRPVREAANAPA
jgi:hypothetical protein